MLNVDGTRNAVELANTLGVGAPPHLLGRRRRRLQGRFREDKFDQGQKLPRRTTARSSSPRDRPRAMKVPWRVYRPAIVVGHSKTGEMDKIDGPYYFFKAIQKLRQRCPRGSPRRARAGPRTSYRSTTSPPRWTTSPTRPASTARPSTSSPRSRRSGDVINTFARAAHAPQPPCASTSGSPTAAQGRALGLQLPALKDIERTPGRLRDPRRGARSPRASCAVRHARHRAGARGVGHRGARAGSYAEKLWDYWERNLDPDLFKDRSFAGAVNGKTVVITGASSGIGRAAAIKIAEAGGIPILVARTEEKLEDVKREIEATAAPRRPTRATSPTPTRSRAGQADARRPRGDRRAGQQRRPLDPALGDAVLRPLPRLRAHDPAELLRPIGSSRAAAAHDRAQLRPHRQRLVDRRPDQPAALQRLRRVQGRARRVHALVGRR